jgi:hypothetical protein
LLGQPDGGNIDVAHEKSAFGLVELEYYFLAIRHPGTHSQRVFGTGTVFDDQAASGKAV